MTAGETVSKPEATKMTVLASQKGEQRAWKIFTFVSDE